MTPRLSGWSDRTGPKTFPHRSPALQLRASHRRQGVLMLYEGFELLQQRRRQVGRPAVVEHGNGGVVHVQFGQVCGGTNQGHAVSLVAEL